MSLITVSSLTKSFGAMDLFTNVSFTVAKGSRLALVGPNGVGKTTLLRIIVGADEASSGEVHRARGARIGYLPQEADFEMTGTLWDACHSVFDELIRMQEQLHQLESQMATHADEVMDHYGKLQEEFERRGGYTYVTRIKQVLTGLGFGEEDYTLSLDHLSGGQRTRAYLARLLLSNPDLLLLDEPTNHLDIAAVEWLENYLAQWDGAAVVVSHDRYFLDKACNVILEMHPGVFELYHGNYSAYLHQRQERADRRQETFESERDKLLKDMEYIKKNIAGQNVQQAKGKLRRLTRTVQAIEQVGMEAVLNTNWSQLDVETTTESVWRGRSREACARFAFAGSNIAAFAFETRFAKTFRRVGDSHARPSGGLPRQIAFPRTGYRIASNGLRGVDRTQRRRQDHFLENHSRSDRTVGG